MKDPSISRLGTTPGTTSEIWRSHFVLIWYTDPLREMAIQFGHHNWAHPLNPLWETESWVFRGTVGPFGLAPWSGLSATPSFGRLIRMDDNRTRQKGSTLRLPTQDRPDIGRRGQGADSVEHQDPNSSIVRAIVHSHHEEQYSFSILVSLITMPEHSILFNFGGCEKVPVSHFAPVLHKRVCDELGNLSGILVTH